MVKVAKFGGSSLADATQFKKVKDIILADPDIRIVAVSAPGKRSSDDYKLTDLLYLCHAHAKFGMSCETTFKTVADRFCAIDAELGLNSGVEAELAELQQQIDEGTLEDMVASRGEYFCAKLMAKFLGWRFLDAAEWLQFNHHSNIDVEKSSETLQKLAGSDKVVVPGFYGTMPDGEIKTLTRGGSDITGAIAAAAIDADVYENWTDVSGILMADPAVVNNPKPITYVDYSELRELSFSGAKVLHEQTLFPVMDKKIPVNIRNVNNPQNPGTMIVEKVDPALEEPGFSITGISGVKDYALLSINLCVGTGEVTVARQLLEIFEKYDINDIYITSGIDRNNFLIPKELCNKYKYAIISDIEKIYPQAWINVFDQTALINVVGRKMQMNPTAKANILSILAKNDINTIFVSERSSQKSLVLGVKSSEYERVIRLIYDEVG